MVNETLFVTIHVNGFENPLKMKLMIILNLRSATEPTLISTSPKNSKLNSNPVLRKQITDLKNLFLRIFIACHSKLMILKRSIALLPLNILLDPSRNGQRPFLRQKKTGPLPESYLPFNPRAPWMTVLT